MDGNLTLEILAGIGALGGVSGFAVLIKTIIDAKKTKAEAQNIETDTSTNYFKKAMEEMTAIAENYKKQLIEEKEERKEKDTILKETQETLAKFAKIISANDYEGFRFPLPRWSKRYPSFAMDWVNPSYEEHFLFPLNKTSKDYINKTDEEIWGKELADNFKENDIKSLGNKGFWIGHEVLQIGDLDLKSQYLIVKWPKRMKDDNDIWKVVSIEGMAIPMNK